MNNPDNLFSPIQDIKEFRQLLTEHSLVLLYVTSEDCGVCNAILPRLQDLLKDYNKVQSVKCNINNASEIAGQYLIMTVPTVCLFMESKEVFRGSRFIDFNKFERQLQFFHDNVN